MAERLGLTVGELRTRMSGPELLQWEALERIEAEAQRRAAERLRRTPERPPEGSPEALQRELDARAEQRLRDLKR